MPSKTSSDSSADAIQSALHHWQWQSAHRSDLLPSKPPPPALTVTVSREYGARGEAVAHEVGTRLDWPVYDRCLLEKISEETDLRTELIESVDEKRTNWLVECLESLSGKTTVTGRYIGNLSNVLRSLGAHGHCVIVGRGASIVLRPETTLRVRVVAPLAERVRNTRNQLSLTEHEAMRYVEKIDSERASFVKEHFHVDPNDVHRFDLVLNTSRFSDGACADLVVDALGKLGDRNRKTAPTRGSCI